MLLQVRTRPILLVQVYTALLAIELPVFDGVSAYSNTVLIVVVMLRPLSNLT